MDIKHRLRAVGIGGVAVLCGLILSFIPVLAYFTPGLLTDPLLAPLTVAILLVYLAAPFLVGAAVAVTIRPRFVPVYVARLTGGLVGVVLFQVWVDSLMQTGVGDPLELALWVLLLVMFDVGYRRSKTTLSRHVAGAA